MKNKYISPELDFIAALSRKGIATNDISVNYNDIIGADGVDPDNNPELFE